MDPWRRVDPEDFITWWLIGMFLLVPVAILAFTYRMVRG